jgi:hypothetical protein
MKPKTNKGRRNTKKNYKIAGRVKGTQRKKKQRSWFRHVYC